jgi:hypothetical protein
VFVSSQKKIGFKIVGRLQGIRCWEETGPDWLGSDELRVVMTSMPELSFAGPPIGPAVRKYDRNGFDSTAGRSDTFTQVNPLVTLARVGPPQSQRRLRGKPVRAGRVRRR